MTKDPYNPAEFMKAFDPQAIQEMFDPKNMLAAFQQGSKEFDISKLMEQNRKQFDAMAEANKAAAETYNDLIAKQMEVFQKVIAPAQALMTDTSDSDKTKATNEMIADALDLMKALAENVRTANEEALAAFKAELDKARKDSSA